MQLVKYLAHTLTLRLPEMMSNPSVASWLFGKYRGMLSPITYPVPEKLIETNMHSYMASIYGTKYDKKHDLNIEFQGEIELSKNHILAYPDVFGYTLQLTPDVRVKQGTVYSKTLGKKRGVTEVVRHKETLSYYGTDDAPIIKTQTDKITLPKGPISILGTRKKYTPKAHIPVTSLVDASDIPKDLLPLLIPFGDPEDSIEEQLYTVARMRMQFIKYKRTYYTPLGASKSPKAPIKEPEGTSRTLKAPEGAHRYPEHLPLLYGPKNIGLTYSDLIRFRPAYREFLMAYYGYKRPNYAPADVDIPDQQYEFTYEPIKETLTLYKAFNGSTKIPRQTTPWHYESAPYFLVPPKYSHNSLIYTLTILQILPSFDCKYRRKDPHVHSEVLKAFPALHS